jgi:hypothetical protein
LFIPDVNVDLAIVLFGLEVSIEEVSLRDRSKGGGSYDEIIYSISIDVCYQNGLGEVCLRVRLGQERGRHIHGWGRVGEVDGEDSSLARLVKDQPRSTYHCSGSVLEPANGYALSQIGVVSLDVHLLHESHLSSLNLKVFF